MAWATINTKSIENLGIAKAKHIPDLKNQWLIKCNKITTVLKTKIKKIKAVKVKKKAR